MKGGQYESLVSYVHQEPIIRKEACSYAELALLLCFMLRWGLEQKLIKKLSQDKIKTLKTSTVSWDKRAFTDRSVGVRFSNEVSREFARKTLNPTPVSTKKRRCCNPLRRGGVESCPFNS